MSDIVPQQRQSPSQQTRAHAPLSSQQSISPSSISNLSTPKSTNSVVLESILNQIDRQDDTIKQLQRSAKQHRETTTRHEELIQQQQLLIANLLQQQSSLFTMLSSVNDKQQLQQQQQNQHHQQLQALDSNGVALSEGGNTVVGNNNNNNNNTNPTCTHNNTHSNDYTDQQNVINQLSNKLTLKEQQLAELLTQQADDQQTITVINQGYHLQSQEIEKLNKSLQKLTMDLQICQSELQKANSANDIDSSKQVIKLKPVYETLDQQLKRLETNIQTQSKTGVQLIIKTLVGRATIVECDISDTIAVVKYKIAEQTAIPLKDQILLKDGKELVNERSILELGLLNQTTLHLILKNRGRGQ